MPRRFLRKITPRSETLRNHRLLKPFSRFFGDPRLWSLQRRTVTPAFGAGLAICFVPLPIHIPLAASGSCEILTLTLGPLHLNLLGLVIDLNQVGLTITAVPGAGNLLGNLLCAVAHLLDAGGPLATLLQGLAGLLNQILAQL